MLKRLLKKRGSAYLMAIGVLGILMISAFAISKLTVSGRWNTVFSSNDKRAEECAEAASNLMFKYIKEKMNDDSVFYKNILFPNPKEILNSEYMYFRLPAVVGEANLQGLSNMQSKGMDIQCDFLSNTALAPFYEKGIYYTYNSMTDNKGPLSPLGEMYKSYGGKVEVRCKAEIKQCFGILADNPKYKTAGIELPVKKATGFLSSLLDKILPMDAITEIADKIDPVREEDGNNFKIDLIEFIPDSPEFLKCPELPNTLTFQIPWPPYVMPVKPLLQPILNKIWEAILKALKIRFTPRGIVERIPALKNLLTLNIPLGGIIDKFKEAIKKCLPEQLSMFAGQLGFGVTVEKKGFLEVVTELDFYPKANDDSHVIKKRLVAMREFRVADIQPIAPDYTFFVANSKLTYENEEVENPDNWQGNDSIDWNDGNGDLVLHNFPDFDKIKDFVDTLIHNFTDLGKLLRNVYLPGQVRINGTNKMYVKIGLIPSFDSLSLDSLKKTEILALVFNHKEGKAACHSHKHDEHQLIPGVDSIPFLNFWSDSKAFDWPYMGGGSPGGMGSYWVPIPPRFARSCLFGQFHISMPFSLRVEGYLRKVYSHIKIHLVHIMIPAIPPWFPGFAFQIPWLWAIAYDEPYGFCNWPGYDSDDKASKAWDPNNASNLPANLYSTAQYLKKASYYYNSSDDFNRDISGRSTDGVFNCDGVTFVNDNLTLPSMTVKGRGIIVAAGNITINGNITRENYGDCKTIFSLVARNGAIIIGNANTIEACLYGDRGFLNQYKAVKIDGNLVVNRFKRSDMSGNVDIHYNSINSRSSLLSMIRPIAKYEPTRYHVTLSSKLAAFRFEKIKN